MYNLLLLWVILHNSENYSPSTIPCDSPTNWVAVIGIFVILVFVSLCLTYYIHKGE